MNSSAPSSTSRRPWLIGLGCSLLLCLTAILLGGYRPTSTAPLPALWQAIVELWTWEVGGVQLGTVVMVGFAAQMVDGALGMAYGLLSTSFLLSVGVSPAVASASVHIAEMGTTGASGLAHWRAGNINFKLWRRLLLPGALGALLGVALLTQIDGKALRPWIDAYLLGCALWLLLRALRGHIGSGRDQHSRKSVGGVALLGGFLDAVGGGGWGPVVSGSLLRKAANVRQVIGSVCAAEFVIASVTGVSLALSVGLMHWQIIAALVLGGVLAAPLAAKVCGLLPARALCAVVGVLLAGLSLRSLLPLFG